MAKRGRPSKKKEVQEPIQKVKESSEPIKDISSDLKKEKEVQASDLNTITLDNVCEKWDTL